MDGHHRGWEKLDGNVVASSAATPSAYRWTSSTSSRDIRSVSSRSVNNAFRFGYSSEASGSTAVTNVCVLWDCFFYWRNGRRKKRNRKGCRGHRVRPMETLENRFLDGSRERERGGGFVAIETTNSNEKQTNKRHESNEENPVDFGTEPVLNYNEKKNNKKQKKGTKESLESHPGGSGDRVGKSSR